VGLTSISKKKNNGLLKNKLKIILLLVFISNITITSLKATPISRDVEITLLTPFGTPMAEAKVLVTKQDGTQLIAIADTLGKIIVQDAPGGKVNIRVLSWRNMPINYVAGNVGTGTVTVENIGQLTVQVLDARGNGLPQAFVEVSDPAHFASVTDSDGKIIIELPSGAYVVSVSKGYRTIQKAVLIKGGMQEKINFTLDILVSIKGWELSTSETIGLIITLLFILFIIYIFIHKYILCLRRHQAKIVWPPEAKNPCPDWKIEELYAMLVILFFIWGPLAAYTLWLIMVATSPSIFYVLLFLSIFILAIAGFRIIHWIVTLVAVIGIYMLILGNYNAFFDTLKLEIILGILVYYARYRRHALERWLTRPE
jgi:hypothetical protein